MRRVILALFTLTLAACASTEPVKREPKVPACMQAGHG
jgi:type IV pilus biogenesis protein CpaD/CtpE